MFTVLTHAFYRWLELRRRRENLRALLRKDDHLLDDIGMIRSEIERALELPLEEDARAQAAAWSKEILCFDLRR